MLRVLVLIIAAFALGIPSCAIGREWPATAGWDIIEGDTYCAIHLEYEGKGETELSVLLEVDGSVVVGMSNGGWSIEKDEQQDLTYSVNGTVYSGGKSVGVGSTYGKRGFATSFGEEFLKDFAASSYLIVRKGNVLVDNLSLKGSAAALVVAKRCTAALKRDIAAAEKEKRRFADIADDPFAKSDTKSSSSMAVRGSPIGNPASWFTDDDFPAEARRANAQGRIAILLSVDLTGRVVGCQVTASTGNAALDDTTCRLATRRGRFTIQKDSEGNPQSYSYPISTSWVLREQ